MRWRQIEKITHVNPNHLDSDFVIKWRYDGHNLVSGTSFERILKHAKENPEEYMGVLVCRVTDRPKRFDKANEGEI